VYYENKSDTTGTSKTQLMREDRWRLAEPKVYDGRNDKNNRQQSNRGNPGSGNGRAPSCGFRGGGRFNSRNRGFKNGRGGSNFPKTNNQRWSENANEQSGQQSGQSNRNQSGGKKRHWGGKGGGKGGNQ
jgi:hypothetical protein